MKKTFLTAVLLAAMLAGCSTPTIEPQITADDSPASKETAEATETTDAAEEASDAEATSATEPDTTPSTAPDAEPDTKPDAEPIPEQPTLDEIKIGEIVGTLENNHLIAAKHNGVVCIFVEGELFSYGEYDDVISFDFDYDNLFVTKKNGDKFDYMQLLYNGKTNAPYTAGSLEKYGNFLLSDIGICTNNLQQTVNFEDFADGFTVTSKELTGDGYGFIIKGTDSRGRTVTFEHGSTAPNDYSYGTNPIFTDDGIDMVYKSDFYSYKANYIYITGPVPDSMIHKWGDYTVIDGYGKLIKGNKTILLHSVESNSIYYGIEIIGDYLAVYSQKYNDVRIGKVYNKELTAISEYELKNFTELSDGRYIAMVDSYSLDKHFAIVFDTDAGVVYQTENGRLPIHIGRDYMFMKDADGVYRLYSPDNELLCEYPEIAANAYFIKGFTGTYKEHGAEGHYFIFHDYNDIKTDDPSYSKYEYGVRTYECYYIPSTGVGGILDLGYSVEEGAAEKPVLYLYPEAETDVTITFDRPDVLTTVYPAYNGSWSVTAQPDGTLTDASGRSYYCLYWEENYNLENFAFTDGFCVNGEDSAAFLEDALAKLGFTEREANEFIIYWLPRLEQNEFNLIRFELTEEREAANGLNISPAPDSLLRVLMHIKAVDEYTEIPEQELPTFERSGFVAVEWGGCEH